MKAGLLQLTLNDVAELEPIEINYLVDILTSKKDKEEEKEEEKENPYPSKEEFKETVRKLIEQGKLDKKFEETNG